MLRPGGRRRRRSRSRAESCGSTTECGWRGTWPYGSAPFTPPVTSLATCTKKTFRSIGRTASPWWTEISYGFTDPATGRAFANNLGRLAFQASEAQDDHTNRNQNHDRFGLAVIIFHLLTGFHPYTVVNLHSGQPAGPSAALGAYQSLAVPAEQPHDGGGASAVQRGLGSVDQRAAELFERCFYRQYQGQPRPPQKNGSKPGRRCRRRPRRHQRLPVRQPRRRHQRSRPPHHQPRRQRCRLLPPLR